MIKEIDNRLIHSIKNTLNQLLELAIINGVHSEMLLALSLLRATEKFTGRKDVANFANAVT